MEVLTILLGLLMFYDVLMRRQRVFQFQDLDSLFQRYDGHSPYVLLAIQVQHGILKRILFSIP